MLGTEDDLAIVSARIQAAKEDPKWGPHLALDGLKGLYGLPANIVELKRITEIDLNNSAVEDISPLAEMPWLRCLRLSNTNISDLSVVSHLPNLIPTYAGEAARGIFFKNTEIKDANVVEISKIEDSKLRAQLLYDYYSLSNLAQDNVSEIGSIRDIPVSDAGLDFIPNEDLKFMPKKNTGISVKEIEEIGDIRSVCVDLLDSILEQTSVSNRLSRLNRYSRLYYVELEKDWSEASIDLIWAYGGIICGYEKRIRSELGEEQLNIEYADLVDCLADFRAIHGAMLMSTSRGALLNRRSFEIEQSMRLEEFVRVLRVVSERVIVSGLLTEESKLLLEGMNDEAAVRSSRMSAQTSASATNNLILSFAKTVMISVATGYGASALYQAVPPQNIKLIVDYMTSNASVLIEFSAAAGFDPSWFHAFMRWINLNCAGVAK
jgi:hypothetical protein